MKSISCLFLTAAVTLSLCACGGSNSTTNSATTEASTAQTTAIANPVEEYTTIADAAEAAGFTFDVPESIGTYGNRSYLVIAGNTSEPIIEVAYTKGDSAANAYEYYARKAAGSSDISGDYNEYAEISTIEANGINYTLKGNNGVVNVATWENDGYSFAFGAYGDTALTADEVIGVVSQIF